MKCLVRILGLYDVFHPKSHYKCGWCTVCKDELADFSIPEWNFRDLQKRISHGEKLDQEKSSESKRAKSAKYHEGIKVKILTIKKLTYLLVQAFIYIFNFSNNSLLFAHYDGNCSHVIKPINYRS
jgi:hypothetical protein